MQGQSFNLLASLSGNVLTQDMCKEIMPLCPPVQTEGALQFWKLNYTFREPANIIPVQIKFHRTSGHIVPLQTWTPMGMGNLAASVNLNRRFWEDGTCPPQWDFNLLHTGAQSVFSTIMGMCGLAFRPKNACFHNS